MSAEREKLRLEADRKKRGEDDDKSTRLKRGKSTEDQDNGKNRDEITMKKPKIKETIEPGRRGESIESRNEKLEHGTATQMERDDGVLGGERIRKYLSEKGKRCDTYKSLILISRKTGRKKK